MASESDDAVEEIAARDRLPRSVAMRKARCAHPDLFAKYQDEGRETAKAVQSHGIAKSAAAVTFEQRVDDLQARERCSRLVALQNAGCIAQRRW